MDKRLDQLKQIDAYLAGELSAEEIVLFEERFRMEQGIQDDVEITRRLVNAIRGYGFKEMLKRIHNEHFRDS
ncbi:MAG TPA: hypothetical protein VK658_16195 [Chryseolinea sp.]|nr:hypothetical protein [Chryseolinea sp.]